MASVATGITRRDAIAGIGLWAAAAGPLADAAGLAVAQAGSSAAPGDAAALERLERFVRLRSAPGHAPVLWIADGLLLARPAGGLAQPLLRNTTLSFTQVVPRGAGRYDFRLEEVGYFRALDGGEVLESWSNPLTGRAVRPRHYRTPESLRLRPEGPAIGAPPAGIEFRGVLDVLAELAGTLSMAEDLYVRIPPVAAREALGDEPARPARAARFLASLGTYTGASSQLRSKPSRWVDCGLHYSTLNSFSDWLGFGDLDGAQSLRLAGRKQPWNALHVIPAWLRERIEREHAGFLDVPRRWLADGGSVPG